MIEEKLKATLKAALESERAQLLSEIEEYEIEGQESLSDVSGENNYRDHMADQGSATFARELDMTLEDNAKEDLLRIDAALARMESGTYGICTRCGGIIRDERLEAMPSAELCIECKEWEETR